MRTMAYSWFFFAFASTCMLAMTASSTKFDVGGDIGWKVPSAKDTQIYNQWASDNRFQVDDVIKFEYEKDSVMEVTEKEYESCKSDHPIFFSNNGRTEFKFETSGTFYFISGVAGHCERGQKMIIKVMGHSPAPGDSPSDDSGANVMLSFGIVEVLAFVVATVFL